MSLFPWGILGMTCNCSAQLILHYQTLRLLKELNTLLINWLRRSPQVFHKDALMSKCECETKRRRRRKHERTILSIPCKRNQDHSMQSHQTGYGWTSGSCILWQKTLCTLVLFGQHLLKPRVKVPQYALKVHRHVSGQTIKKP